ncbi:hypothetical protein ACOMHN_009573 [Nucella lapillus]
MAARGRGRGGRGAFGRASEDTSSGVHSSILKQARRSGQLNLSGRNLTEVPESVWRINLDVPEEARSVSLDNTDERWWEQVELTKLILASNALAFLGEGLGQLPALTVLDVHDNRLVSLPDALGDLENLQKLDISRNQLSELPSCIGRLHSLVSLHAEHNKLTQLCTDVVDCRKLEELDVSHNDLGELPQYIGLLSGLFRLNVANNRLPRLPPEIGAMDCLRYFDATHNQLTRLPEEFGCLGKLELLYLRHNHLTHLPLLHTCVSLKELHVGNNALMGVTGEHLQHLTSLTFLDLRDNKLARLPDEVTLLQGLERLDLTNNDISVLPYSLGTLNSLKSIVLDGNPLKSIRRDIIMNYRTISLISHPSKVMLRVLLNRLKWKSEEILAEEQARFRPKRSTVEQIFDIRILIEKHLQHQRDLFHNFIDFKKAFDRVWHDGLWQVMRNYNIDSNIIDVIKVLYNDSKSAVLLNDQIGEYFRTRVGVRQGCLLSPALFNIYSENIMMEALSGFQPSRGTAELKKYLRSRLEEPALAPAAGAVPSKPSVLPSSTGDAQHAHDMHQFKNLDFSGHQATAVPDALWDTARGAGVMAVNLSKNLFTQLPDSLVLLADSLTELNLGFNKVTTLSPDIGRYLKLTCLDLRNNGLCDLPAQISCLQAVRELVLACNRLTEIPPCVYTLQRLEILFVNDNQLTAVDAAGLRRLGALGTLDLQNNSISAVPPELGHCSQLKSLQLGGNPCRNPRPAILAKGTAAILEYLRSRIVT